MYLTRDAVSLQGDADKNGDYWEPCTFLLPITSIYGKPN